MRISVTVLQYDKEIIFLYPFNFREIRIPSRKVCVGFGMDTLKHLRRYNKSRASFVVVVYIMGTINNCTQRQTFFDHIKHFHDHIYKKLFDTPTHTRHDVYNIMIKIKHERCTSADYLWIAKLYASNDSNATLLCSNCCSFLRRTEKHSCKIQRLIAYNKGWKIWRISFSNHSKAHCFKSIDSSGGAEDMYGNDNSHSLYQNYRFNRIGGDACMVT